MAVEGAVTSAVSQGHRCSVSRGGVRSKLVLVMVLGMPTCTA